MFLHPLFQQTTNQQHQDLPKSTMASASQQPQTSITPGSHTPSLAGSVIEASDGLGGTVLIRIQNMSCTSKFFAFLEIVMASLYLKYFLCTLQNQKIGLIYSIPLSRSLYLSALNNSKSWGKVRLASNSTTMQEHRIQPPSVRRSHNAPAGAPSNSAHFCQWQNVCHWNKKHT